MKRFLSVLGIVCAIVIGAATTASAETIIAKDTTVYYGTLKIVVHTRANDNGEINVCYVCYPIDANNSDGEPLEVQTNKETYESDKAQDSAAKRITKNVNGMAKADRVAVNVGEEGEK